MGKKKKSHPASPLSPTPNSEQTEASGPDSKENPKPVRAHVPEGLVPSDQLPSAVDVLAQLFPPEERHKHENGRASLPASIFSDMDLSALSAGFPETGADFLGGDDEIAAEVGATPLSFEETAETVEINPAT